MEMDPVCGMAIDPYLAAGQSEYLGEVYYFCSIECKEAFDQEPERYVGDHAGAQGDEPL